MSTGSAELEMLEHRLRMLWRRDGFVIDDPDGTARLVRLLIEQQGPGSAGARTVLRETGIQARWKEVLAKERSAELTRWLLPNISGPVLTLLAGDFNLASALHSAGVEILALERLAEYSAGWPEHPFPVLDQENISFPATAVAGTVLMCTALDREHYPNAILDLLATMNQRRWVIVENCVDADNSEAFHLLVDQFFCVALSRFHIPSRRKCRTQGEWLELLAQYGSVVAVDSRTDMPGVPLSHDLFVLERLASTECLSLVLRGEG